MGSQINVNLFQLCGACRYLSFLSGELSLQFFCQEVIIEHKAGDEMHDFRCLVLTQEFKRVLYISRQVFAETCLQIYKINNALVHGKCVGFAEL